MAETHSKNDRKPLHEKSINLHSNVSDGSDTSSSSRRWFSFKSRSGRKPNTANEVSTLDILSKLVVIFVPCSDVSLTSLLSQVCGGPLESVYQFRKDPQPFVLLEFVRSCHAQRFQAYVRCGRCALNGRQVSTIDLPANVLSRMVDKMRTSQPQRQPSAPAFARRTLHIFVPVSLPTAYSSYDCEKRPPRLVRSRLDIRYLMDIFAKLGNVLQVRPMVFRQSIAFAVDFDCIASAVNAKMLFDDEKRTARCGIFNEDSIFSGLEQWSLDYARDSTERACLF